MSTPHQFCTYRTGTACPVVGLMTLEQAEKRWERTSEGVEVAWYILYYITIFIIIIIMDTCGTRATTAVDSTRYDTCITQCDSCGVVGGTIQPQYNNNTFVVIIGFWGTLFLSGHTIQYTIHNTIYCTIFSHFNKIQWDKRGFLVDRITPVSVSLHTRRTHRHTHMKARIFAFLAL